MSSVLSVVTPTSRLKQQQKTGRKHGSCRPVLARAFLDNRKQPKITPPASSPTLPRRSPLPWIDSTRMILLGIIPTIAVECKDGTRPSTKQRDGGNISSNRRSTVRRCWRKRHRHHTNNNSKVKGKGNMVFGGPINNAIRNTTGYSGK